MPLNPSSGQKRQTQNLRHRIQNLTRYEPNSMTSDEERDVNTTIPISRSKNGFLGIKGDGTSHPPAILAHATEGSILQEQGNIFNKMQENLLTIQTSKYCK